MEVCLFAVWLVGELVGWMAGWVWLPCASLSASQYKLRCNLWFTRCILYVKFWLSSFLGQLNFFLILSPLSSHIEFSHCHTLPCISEILAAFMLEALWKGMQNLLLWSIHSVSRKQLLRGGNIKRTVGERDPLGSTITLQISCHSVSLVVGTVSRVFKELF